MTLLAIYFPPLIGHTNTYAHTHARWQVVFDSILAADDFLSFKKMMVRRNRELEVSCLAPLFFCFVLGSTLLFGGGSLG